MNIAAYIGSQFSHPRGIGGQLSTFLMNRINTTQYKSIENELNTKNPKKVLDIGFGNGHQLHTLTSQSSADFWGIDISSDMLCTASQTNKAFIEGGRMTLSLGTVQRLPFSDSSFDFIYTVNTVYFWDDLLKALLEIYRTLSPGGTFVNAFYSDKWLNKTIYTKYGFQKYTPAALVTAAQIIGFKQINLKEIRKNGVYCLSVTKA